MQPPAPQQIKQQAPSMTGQKIAAYVSQAEESEEFWAAIIVFFGVLMLLSTIAFYPIYVVFGLAALCGAIASKKPAIGVILGVLFGLPAVLYQSAVFAWFYLLVIVLVLFQAFTNWMVIAVLEILVMAPFAFQGFPFIGYITIAGMSMGALFFGSKKSLAISLSAVIAILLLSSIWAMDNSAYMPLNLKNYQPGKAELQFSKPAVDIMNMGSEIGKSIGKLFDLKNLSVMASSIGFIFGRIIDLALKDSLIIQLLGWGIALYLLGWLPPKIKKHSQIISSVVLLITIPVNYIASTMYGVSFRFEFIGGIVLAMVALGAMEHFGLNISKESELDRKEKMKSYGKFGMSDVSAGGEERSMDDVGGYEDIKKELRDAIIMPLEKKEIAFAYGIKPPAGILLFGPPGTGKTMLMRALAKELKYNFIEVRCSQILSQWYGESEKNVAEIFSNARKNAPTVLFFDEIDSIAKRRGADSMDTVGPRVLTTILQEIDGGTKSKATVMVIGATNLPNELDPALIRPGRLDKIIYMHLPDPEARKAIINGYIKKMKKDIQPKDLDMDVVVKKTERFSGADMKNVVTEAQRLAAREATDKGVVVPITMAHFLRVLEAVKPSTGLSQLDMYEQFKLDFERRVGADKGKQEETAKESAVKWSDVAGMDDIKKALLEAIELPLLHEADMKEFKVKPSKGILLFGPPGTGKTLIVRAAANELKASFQALSAAEVMKKGYTQAMGVIKEAFNRARENPPGIIFVDEIETFAPARGAGGSSEILGQFLTEMDGVKGQKGVLVIAATNKPALMDAAIMRPGRFDKIFFIPPPDMAGRVEMFRIHLASFAEKVDLKLLAEMTPGFSGADIADICQNVKMKALRSKLEGKPEEISTKSVISVIKTRRPSVTQDILEEYKKFMENYGERR
ncbi:VCP-like ATPase [Candidatus Bilamarchaeum dharawalense]|uniref:VCP-like ATPase n=1 Tax=Candidatus Bilamarchaeum dharawalense TaxID=2885759 RepID=A0A5E4LPL0_9ARCH|nr:VCP-like ATPase [Candidatus Bilamarchaeum dharawalense]